MSSSFSNLNLEHAVLDNLTKLGFKKMTPIQAESLPMILDGKDVIAQAKTGSGKTVAFGIGLLSNLNITSFHIQSLVLCPTRELADQVAKELRALARFTNNIKVLTLCGGASMRQQISSLSHSAHIIVGTPGRVIKHLNNGSLHFKGLNTLVLDEADRMLDMGFDDAITEIVSHLPKDNRQTLLFSATYPDEISYLSESIQNNAIKIQAKNIDVDNKIKQIFYEVFPEQIIDNIQKILAFYKPENAIIFCNTKLQVKNIEKSLNQLGCSVLAIHGDLEQYDRNDVLVQFSNKSCSILVATDVAARGIDIKNLGMVINASLPHDETTYIHRIGRTGRCENDGLAITLFAPENAIKAEMYENKDRQFNNLSELGDVKKHLLVAPNKTLVIEAGKKDKLRAGDILGALTGDCGLNGSDIGIIDLYENQSYVAISSNIIEKACQRLKKSTIKKRRIGVWLL